MSYALLIDDDVALVSEMTKVVESAGLRLDTASSWDEGLGKFNGLAPDVVIADYNLPGSRHGLQLLLEIARLRPSVRLVLISAYLNEGDVEKVRALGLVDEVRRKSDPVQTARYVMGLVDDAREKQGQNTDWAAFSRARRRKAISESDLEDLDSFLQTERLGQGG